MDVRNDDAVNESILLETRTDKHMEAMCPLKKTDLKSHTTELKDTLEDKLHNEEVLAYELEVNEETMIEQYDVVEIKTELVNNTDTFKNGSCEHTAFTKVNLVNHTSGFKCEYITENADILHQHILPFYINKTVKQPPLKEKACSRRTILDKPYFKKCNKCSFTTKDNNIFKEHVMSHSSSINTSVLAKALKKLITSKTG